MMHTLFHMWEPLRREIIAKHSFYVEQAQRRLLSQFQNIKAEADAYGKEWLNSCRQYFDPDRHDSADFYEQAHEESIEFYQMLKDMENRTRLSVVAGIFHEWDKQLRSWTQQEIHHWHQGDEVNKAIWKANFIDVIDFFEGLGWTIKSNEFYKSIDQCRLVVNAYKHGDGIALRLVKKLYPEFIGGLMIDPIYINFAEHTDLIVEEKHIAEFSNAIIEFWNNVPEYIYEKESLKVSDWFSKAYEKDQLDERKKQAAK